MKILVTGAKGFVGKNLCITLKQMGHTVYEYDVDSTVCDLEKYTYDCEFVFNLAGVNRPKSEDEFMKGNFGFAKKLLTLLGSKASFNYEFRIATVCVPQTPCIIPPTVSKIRGVMNLHLTKKSPCKQGEIFLLITCWTLR